MITIDYTVSINNETNHLLGFNNLPINNTRKFHVFNRL